MNNETLSSTRKLYENLKKDYADLSNELKKVHNQYSDEIREKDIEIMKLKESIPPKLDPSTLLPKVEKKQINLALPPELLNTNTNTNTNINININNIEEDEKPPQIETNINQNISSSSINSSKKIRPLFESIHGNTDRSADLLAYILNENHDNDYNKNNENEVSNEVEEMFATAAESQLKYQNEINRLNKELEETKLDNDDLKNRIKLLQSQEKVLKDELRRVSPEPTLKDKIDFSNQEYLKNIILNYATSKNDNEKRQLIPVLTQLLSLNKEETERLKSSTNRGIFGFL